MSLTQINKAGLDELALDHVFTIGASGTDHYTFQGEGLNGTVNDPTLYLTRGKTYRFENGTGAHAIRIQSADDGTSGTLYNTGVTNNNTTGTVIVEVQHDAPDVLYYQCASHANMKGIIYVTGALADDGVTTAKLADNAVTTAKIADNAINSAKIASLNGTRLIDDSVGTAKLANNAVNNAKLADNAVTHGKLATGSVGTNALADTSVTLAKLEHGTSSNNGKFLRANNGADPTFETVSTDLVADTTPQLGGNLDLNSNNIEGTGNVTIAGNVDLTDSGRIKLGTGDDLQIYHNGSGSFIDVYTNDFQIRNDASEVMAAFYRNGNVRLYNDGLKQVETFHSSTVGHSPSGGSDITGGGIKTTRTSSHNSNIGYYAYKDSNLVARLTNHGSGPEGILQLYNQGVPKISMNGTNGTMILHGTAGYIQFGDTNSSAHQLDDYEEGIHVMQPSGTTQFSISSTYDEAPFTKIGRLVTVRGLLYITAHSGSAYVRVTMPFTSRGDVNNSYFAGRIGAVMHNNINTGDTGIVTYMSGSSNRMGFYKVSDSGSWSHLVTSDLSVGAEMYFTMSYEI